MRKEEYSFISSDDEGTNIHAVKWMPDAKPIGAVLMVHGMVEYIERYEEFAEYLCGKGFVCAGHDHIGHGRSVSSEDDWGNMHTDNPADVMVEDVFTNYKMFCEQYPDIPHFILGHSMGSYILRQFLIQKADYLDDLTGSIIMGTGTESGAAINGGLVMLKAMARLKGWEHRSRTVEALVFGGGPYKKFDPTNREDFERSWLTKDVERVKIHAEDAKANFRFSINGYRLLMNACKFDNSIKNIRKMKMDIPVLFISGSDDPVGNMGKGVKQAARKFHAAGVSDLSLKLFRGDRHEILNETDRADVFNYIYHWMKKRMK